MKEFITVESGILISVCTWITHTLTECQWHPRSPCRNLVGEERSVLSSNSTVSWHRALFQLRTIRHCFSMAFGPKVSKYEPGRATTHCSTAQLTHTHTHTHTRMSVINGTLSPSGVVLGYTSNRATNSQPFSWELCARWCFVIQKVKCVSLFPLCT